MARNLRHEGDPKAREKAEREERDRWVTEVAHHSLLRMTREAQQVSKAQDRYARIKKSDPEVFHAKHSSETICFDYQRAAGNPPELNATSRTFAYTVSETTASKHVKRTSNRNKRIWRRDSGKLIATLDILPGQVSQSGISLS